MLNDQAIRLGYRECRELLLGRLAERRPPRIQLLTGPRQVGKTTLLLELHRRLGRRAVYAAMDGPESSVPGFWERLWSSALHDAERQGPVVLLLDEIHHAPEWAQKLKGEWDRLVRRRAAVRVVASGSSALHLAAEARESLAGRFEPVVLRHWTASDLVRVLGVSETAAPLQVVRFGAYPGARGYVRDLARWRAYVAGAIVEPAIGKDLLALKPVRHPALLRQLFALCAGQPAEVVSLQKLQGRLTERGAIETIAHYLDLLQEAFLVAALDKHAGNVLRRRKAPPKIVVLSNALLSAMDPLGPPDERRNPARFGRWVENACLAHAWNAGQQVSYWREEPFEVDAVLDGPWGRWAVEVKTGGFTERDLFGLLEFCRRNKSYRPLVIQGTRGREAADRAGARSMDWREFLMADHLA